MEAQKPTSTSAIRSCRLSDMLGRPGRLRIVQELAVAPDELPVGVDLALAPEIADQIEVQRRAILAPQSPEAHSEGHVHRSTDLLVEEDVAGEAVDLVVEPERDLTDAPCTFV